MNVTSGKRIADLRHKKDHSDRNPFEILTKEGKTIKIKI
jgi:hypothetical protein